MSNEIEEPFEGASAMDLSMSLGILTITWTRFEWELFASFTHLTGMKPDKGRVVWYNISSLENRIKIMEQLVDEGEQEKEVKAELLGHFKEAKRLIEMRNKWMHGWWSKSEPGVWALRGLKKPNSPNATTVMTKNSIEKGLEDVLKFVERLNGYNRKLSPRRPNLREL